MVEHDILATALMNGKASVKQAFYAKVLRTGQGIIAVHATWAPNRSREDDNGKMLVKVTPVERQESGFINNSGIMCMGGGIRELLRNGPRNVRYKHFPDNDFKFEWLSEV